MPCRQNRQKHLPTPPLPRILLVAIAHLPLMNPSIPTLQYRFPEAMFHSHLVAIRSKTIVFEFEQDVRVGVWDVVEEGV